MTYAYIDYEKDGHLAVVTINRPEVMNAIHPPANAELEAVWSSIAADNGVWVVILTGAGPRAFSAGADLKYRTTQADEAKLRAPAHGGLSAMERCHKPIIAAVNGYAVGGGLEIALRCDIIIAAEHAQLGLPEARRGLLADAGGVIKLPRRIPYHITMGLVLTGKLMTAAEAQRAGLVNEVVPSDSLMETARDVIACSALAVQATKQFITLTYDLPAEVALSRMESLEAVRRLRRSDDYAEGPRAFSEKREPQWTGK